MQIYIALSTENEFKLLLRNKTMDYQSIFKPESLLAIDLGKSEQFCLNMKFLLNLPQDALI